MARGAACRRSASIWMAGLARGRPATSPDVRCGHPGLRSLRARYASRHAAAEGRAACMTHAKPRHRASLCLAGRRPPMQSPPSRRAAVALRGTQRPKAALRAYPLPPRRAADRRRGEPPRRRRSAAATAAWRAAAREARGTLAAPPPSKAARAMDGRAACSRRHRRRL